MGTADPAPHLVVGAGAVGIGLGSALLAAGERVAFLARGATAAALRGRGCARTGLLGSAAFGPDAFAVVERADALERPPVATLVATKAFTTREIAESLAAAEPIRSSRGPVVSFQNGLGNAELLADRLGRDRVLSAAVLVGFRRTAPHRVDVTVLAEPIHLGSLFEADPGAGARLAGALSAGGLPSDTSPRVERDLWAKALYNCALNPLGAMLGVPYGALGRSPRTRALMDAVVREIFDVMRSGGQQTHWGAADRYLEYFYGELLPRTASHESSMLQDLRAARRTEIDALCGEVSARGARGGVPTPINDALVQLIHAAEARDGGSGELRATR